MSNFFNQEQLNNITLQDINTESVKDFSTANLNTRLGDLPQYEDLHKKEITQINFEDIKKINLPAINTVQEREFKKKVDKEKTLLRVRVKIFLTIFALVTTIITGFVIYNLIAITKLNNKVENNEVKIKARREQVEREAEQPVNHFKDFEKLSNIEIIVNI